jgi:hypothetical protein
MLGELILSRNGMLLEVKLMIFIATLYVFKRPNENNLIKITYVNFAQGIWTPSSSAPQWELQEND